MNQQTFLRSRLAAAVVALAMLPATLLAQTRVKPGFNLFSAQQDAEIGYQSAVAAERQLPIVNDAVVDSYVNRIGQRLARNAGGPRFRYQFRVVDAHEINAFALPGGYVYVNRGVIENARNEGELAGVLAHEIAHVALRHGTHQASKAYATQAGLSLLGGLLNGRIGQNTANVINAVGGVGLNVLFLKYTRDLESQADVRGAQILAASGYSPYDMASFFRTLQRSDRSQRTSWLSDHPSPPDRIRRIEREAAMLGAGDPTQRSAELRRVQGRLGR